MDISRSRAAKAPNSWVMQRYPSPEVHFFPMIDFKTYMEEINTTQYVLCYVQLY